jgi:hypothetical protein
MNEQRLQETPPQTSSASPDVLPAAPARQREGTRIQAIVRRCSAFAALGWLGYIGYLLRDCPNSGAICQKASIATTAVGIALGMVIVGHLIGWAASGASGWTHAHHPAH